MTVVSRQSSVARRQSTVVGPAPSTRRRRRSSTGCGGYTIVELMVSTAIMLTVTGAIFSLMNPAQGSAQVQPEVADLQQRVRVGSETLFKEIVMAGAGPYQGPVTGSLINFFAPILPRRIGRVSPDPSMGAGSFRSDAITLSYIPNSYSQTTISQDMPNVSSELKVTPQSNCPNADVLCGFKEKMDVIIFDAAGNFDTFEITKVQADAAHLQHRGQDLTVPYATGSSVTQIVSNTYYLDRTTSKLMKYNGIASDLPIVDNVVDLRFEYFGDPTPPKLPKPPANTANCLYDAMGNYSPLMLSLTPDDGSLVRLTEEMLTDGPYCGGGSNQFDADLLRIRKVRITLRLQATNPAFRAGTDTSGNLRSVSGGDRYIPDYTVSFEVTPRNLNLVR